MAAGAACKLRMYTPSDWMVKLDVNLLQKFRQYMGRFRLFELTYTGASTNGKTEISVPNAVFDATTIQYIKWGVVSSQANDTDAVSGDARKVKVLKLMSDGIYEIEEIALGGASFMLTADTALRYAIRIMHMWCSDWGSGGADAKGNITLGSCAYQEGGMTAKTATTLTGLTVSTKYYYKMTVNGGGQVERDITLGTDATFAAVIALLNAEEVVHSDGVHWDLINGDLRVTTLRSGATASIECAAGSSGTDMFATITDYAEEATVAGALLLTIAATYNESDGSAIFIPASHAANFVKMRLNQLTLANAGLGVLYADLINMGMGSPAGTNFESVSIENGSTQTKEIEDPTVFGNSTGAGKITFSETYITGTETIQAKVLVAVFGTTGSLRGMDCGAV